MANRIYKLSSEQSNLELALSGIPITDSWTYSNCGFSKRREETIPAFLLPVEKTIMGHIGTFASNTQVYKNEIGFECTSGLYKMGPTGTPEPTAEDDKKIFLPLEQIPRVYNEILIAGEDGNTRLIDGSPFQIMGIRRGRNLLPLILAYQNKAKFELAGIYLQPNGQIRLYHPNTDLGEKAKKFSEKFKLGMYKTPIINISQISGEIQSSSTKKDNFPWEDPKEIVKYLNQTVIGQEKAKKTIAVAFSNYMIRANNPDDSDNLPKENIIIAGPPGVGKTLITSLLAKKANLPFAQTKVTGKSSEGYVGENLSSVFKQFELTDKEKAPHGVIFLDEIDKVAKTKGRDSLSDDHQNEIIGWADEAIIQVPKGDKSRETNSLNTKNLLFICAGAFQGLEKVVTESYQGKKTIGFENPNEQQPAIYEENVLQKTKPQHLIEFGLIPELVRRMPTIAILDKLTTEDKIGILTSSNKSPLKQTQNLFSKKGYELTFDDTVPEIIVNNAPEETGASGLNSTCSRLFKDITYDPEIYAEGKKIHITKDLAEKLIKE